MSDTGHPLKGPHFVLTTDGEIHGQDTDGNREIVRRIHACVNACDGISTEELEQGIVQDMRRALAEVVPLLQGTGETGSESRTQRSPIVVEQRNFAGKAKQPAS
jgi:hypothetical protein